MSTKGATEKTYRVTGSSIGALIQIRMSDKLVEQYRGGDVLPPHVPQDRLDYLLAEKLIEVAG